MVGIEDTYPEYALTSRLDDLRATEYSYLDEQNHVYLDYTGSGLAAKSQHKSQNERVTTTLFGNPHSVNPTSTAATEAIEKTRARILAHLNASPDEYVVIFTPNATGAARIVAESYPFTAKTKLVLSADNHNSINGIREYARAKGAKTTYIPLTTPDLRIDEAALQSALYPSQHSTRSRSSGSSGPRSWFSSLFASCLGHRKLPPPSNPSTATSTLPTFNNTLRDNRLSSSAPQSPSPASSTTTLKPAPPDNNNNYEKTILTTTTNSSPFPTAESRKAGLFAYPAQSNFSGTRHPLSYIARAQAAGYHVLLDAAAYLPTSPLDLSPSSPYRPDFLIMSFYKLFGTPTGVGCLVARRDSLTTLLLPNRPWFSGGTITAVTVSTQWHQPSMGSPHEAFEDGTLNFNSIPDILPGLDLLTQTIGLPVLDTRLRCLTGWFLDRLSSLKHSDGKPLAIIYGPSTSRIGNRTTEMMMMMRGATVAFNLLDAEGKVIDERIIDIESARVGISLRTGCFCNPGAAETAFGLKKEKLEQLSKITTTNKLSPDMHMRGRRLGMDDYIRLVGLPSGGAIRVSFGVASNTADVDRFFEFVEGTYRDRVTSVEGLKPRERW